MSKVRPSTKVSSPPRTMASPGALPAQRPTVRQQLGPTAGADTGSHISDPIRAALNKHPEQAAEIRRVAGTK
jgi:hypothetical protein